MWSSKKETNSEKNPDSEIVLVQTVLIDSLLSHNEAVRSNNKEQQEESYISA